MIAIVNKVSALIAHTEIKGNVPFGKMRPSLCLLLTMSTSTPPFTAGLPLTGMHLWAGWV